MKVIKNLVFSAGGLKGFSHYGALCKLYDENLISNLEECVGTSAGAITATLHCAGFNPYDVWNFLMNIDVSKLVDINVKNISKCGAESGEKIYSVIDEILEKKTNKKSITMIELYEISKIKLTIVGSCLSTKEIVYFNHETYPNIPVVDAVRISISVPGLFIPYIWDNKAYLDGALLEHYAISFLKDKLDSTLGIFIHGNYSTDYYYPEEFPLAIINMLMYYFQVSSYDNYIDNTIIIKTEIPEISVFNFKISDDYKIKLFDIGYKNTEKFLIDKNLINKK